MTNLINLKDETPDNGQLVTCQTLSGEEIRACHMIDFDHEDLSEYSIFYVDEPGTAPYFNGDNMIIPTVKDTVKWKPRDD